MSSSDVLYCKAQPIKPPVSYTQFSFLVFCLEIKQGLNMEGAWAPVPAERRGIQESTKPGAPIFDCCINKKSIPMVKC